MSSDSPPLRKSRAGIFGRTSLGPLTPLPKNDTSSPDTSSSKNKLKLKRHKLTSASTPSLLNLQRQASISQDVSAEHSPPSSASSAKDSGSATAAISRPVLSKKGRPSSIFGSLRSLRGEAEDTPPATATSASSKPGSLIWRDSDSRDDLTDIGRNRNVLHHGETQTNSGLFWKKKEYLVLTDTHLIRLKSQSRAAEVFDSIPASYGRVAMQRHGSSASVDHALDTVSLQSDASGEKISGIPLEHIVGVILVEDGKSSHGIEVFQLDGMTGQSSNISFQFVDIEDRDLWLRSIRQWADRARLLDSDPLSAKLAEYAARVVEREQDYDVSNFKIYKAMKRAAGRQGSQSSPEDSAKAVFVPCFVVIGTYKMHVISLPRSISKTSTSSLSDLSDGGSIGILALTSISVSRVDDSLTISTRLPFKPPRVIQLASLAGHELASRLRLCDSLLRPLWTYQPFTFDAVQIASDSERESQQVAFNQEFHGFDKTLVAFCVAYDFDPSTIRYTVNLMGEDAPCFELLEPAASSGKDYTPQQLLAVMRSLRYNESFTSISFSRINLDFLQANYDPYGDEHDIFTLRYGENHSTIKKTSMLISEIRALATTNKRLRRMDFSHCFSPLASNSRKGNVTPNDDSGVAQALAPLCKNQLTNVDWIALNNIELSETDLDYLIDMAAERNCHFRAVETSRCGLTDRGHSLLLDALRSQCNTLEILDFSHNPLRIVPSAFSKQLDAFGFIRKLDLSRVAVVSGSTAVLPFETLQNWRLESLKLCGLPLNGDSVDALCGYLSHSRSEVLRELNLSGCALNGREIALIMHSMTLEPNTARYLHLDVSENRLDEQHNDLVRAIESGLAPTHLTMRSLEYESDGTFRKLLLAIALNRSIRVLDLAKLSLPAEASEETCHALEKLFSENSTLQELDLSGEDSRLEVAKFGSGINQAFSGLKQNRSLQILRIQYQRLGLQGASALADVLKENFILQQLHCNCNGITLSGFTDLVNAMSTNSTLLYLPSFEEGRAAALRQTEEQIKEARTKTDGSMAPASSKMLSMRRTLAGIGGGGAGTVNKASPKVAAVPQWTEQDVQAAFRLVSEGWDEQRERLQVFLERNWRIHEGQLLVQDVKPVEAMLAVQRPGTAGSISKVLEKVKIESTPTVEKELNFGERGLLEKVDIDTMPVFAKDPFDWGLESSPGLSEKEDRYDE